MIAMRATMVSLCGCLLCCLMFASCFRDGQSCQTNSISESVDNGLFFHSYKFYPLSRNYVEWDIEEAWLEKQCVIKGSKQEPINGYILRVSFSSPIDWYLDGFDRGLGLVKTRGYDRWFDKLDSNILDRYVPTIPSSDTLICYLVPGIKDSVTVLDSFMLVSQESYTVDEKSSFRHN